MPCAPLPVPRAPHPAWLVAGDATSEGRAAASPSCLAHPQEPTEPNAAPSSLGAPRSNPSRGSQLIPGRVSTPTPSPRDEGSGPVHRWLVSLQGSQGRPGDLGPPGAPGLPVRKPCCTWGPQTRKCPPAPPPLMGAAQCTLHGDKDGVADDVSPLSFIFRAGSQGTRRCRGSTRRSWKPCESFPARLLGGGRPTEGEGTLGSQLWADGGTGLRRCSPHLSGWRAPGAL